MRYFQILSFATLTLLILSGCSGKSYFLSDSMTENPPKTVLILPPENMTSNTEVLEKAYPAIYIAFAQKGYYVIPPEIALKIFNENKLNDASRINQLAPGKFKDIFGADAVLRTKVTEWSSKYMVLTSTVNVGYEMELIDCRSGEKLFSDKKLLSKAPDNGGGSIIGAVVSAAVHAAAVPYEPIASENARMIFFPIPKGEYFETK